MRRHFSRALAECCKEAAFKTIAAAIPGMQYADPFDPYYLARTRWLLTESPERNLEDLAIDGRRFDKLTGRNAIG